MTQTEYEQKKAECFNEFCKRYRIEEPSEQNIESFNWVFDRAYALGKQTETISREEIEKAAEKFADKEYMTNRDEWDALYKGYYHGMKDALGK